MVHLLFETEVLELKTSNVTVYTKGKSSSASEALSAICSGKWPTFHADLRDQKPMRQTREMPAIAQQSPIGT